MSARGRSPERFDPRRHSTVVLRYNEKLPGVSLLTTSVQLPVRTLAVGPHVSRLGTPMAGVPTPTRPGTPMAGTATPPRPTSAPHAHSTRYKDPHSPKYLNHLGRWVPAKLPETPVAHPSQGLSVTEVVATNVTNSMMPNKRGTVRPVTAVHTYADVSPVISAQYVRDADRAMRGKGTLLETAGKPGGTGVDWSAQPSSSTTHAATGAQSASRPATPRAPSTPRAQSGRGGGAASHTHRVNRLSQTSLSGFMPSAPGGKVGTAFGEPSPRAPPGYQTLSAHTGPHTSLAPQAPTVLRTGQQGHPLPHAITGQWSGHPGEDTDRYFREQYSGHGTEYRRPATSRVTHTTHTTHPTRSKATRHSSKGRYATPSRPSGPSGPSGGGYTAARGSSNGYSGDIPTPNNAHASGPFAASADNAFWPKERQSASPAPVTYPVLRERDLVRTVELGKSVVAGSANSKLVGGRWVYIPRPTDGDVVYTDYYGPYGNEQSNYYGRTYHVHANDFVTNRLVNDSAYQRARASMMGIQMLRDRPGLSMDTAIVHGPTETLATKLDTATYETQLGHLHRLHEHANLDLVTA